LNHDLEEKIESRTEQLRKSNDELEAFSYSVSHDLRAPLRGIIGFAAILQEEYGSKLDAEANRIIEVIKENTIKMGQLIDDLLAFSRMGKEDIRKTTVDTNKMVRNIVNELPGQNSNQHIVKWQISELPQVSADINTIRQVWINFLSNAVKYSRNIQQPLITIGSSVEDDFIVFSIRDNGVGFDEKYSNKLFKVFQRLHDGEEFEGTGVGLALAEKIVSKHGGKVWAEGRPNEGACFYFSLPV
jgi:light-regulated signal transduction histidine kinase (bacteriophytochrome)